MAAASNGKFFVTDYLKGLRLASDDGLTLPRWGRSLYTTGSHLMGEKYIQRGWDSYLKMVVPKGASETQIAETRQAFFSGASVLFEGIMRMLDPSLEETDADMQRMTDIQNEITVFGQELDKRIFKLTEH